MIPNRAEPSIAGKWGIYRPMQELGDYLVDHGVLGADDAARVREAATLSGEPIHIVASKLGLAAEDGLADAVASFFQLDRIGRAEFPQAAILPERFKEAFLRSARVLPVEETEDSLILAAADPMNETAIKSIGFAIDKKVELKVAAISDIDVGIEQLYRALQEETVETNGALGSTDLERLLELAAVSIILFT
ncbi:MAG: hypothetical protein AAGL99_18750 [Pseudomonadota bacterium]